MKKIILYVTAAILLAGCSDSFLDTKPLTQKVDQNYYETPEDADQALTACYAVLPTIPPWTNSFLSAELMSDDRFGGGGDNDRVAHAIDGYTTDGTNNMFRDAWTAYYQGIFRCNMLLDNIDKPAWDSEDQKGNIEGQARFLRAYYYFDLAKMFGTVPLLIHAVPVNNPKAPAADIFAQIATDLKIAIENFPAVSVSSADPSDLGRATRWAAEGLMARVFLFYTGYYKTTNLPLADGGTVENSEVVAWLEDCINNSGHDLLPDFHNLWPYSLVTVGSGNTTKDYKYAVDNDLTWVEDAENYETVFAIKYSNTASWSTSIYYSNQINLFFGVRGQSDYNNVFPFGQGWGFGPVNTDMWDNWPSGDIRKEASICNVANVNEGIVSYNPNGDKNMHETQMWQKKYVPINVLNGDLHNYCVDFYNRTADYQLNNMQDLVLLRFADILLMHSELTGTPDGMNAVRDRVGLPPVAYSVEALRDERRYELAFEGIRYYDLLRYGIDYAKAAIGRGEGISVTNSGVAAQMHYNLNRLDETGGFLQIPNGEILLSDGVLEQNPGW